MRGFLLTLTLLIINHLCILRAQTPVIPVSYNTVGSTYTQNFDGLPASGTYSLNGKGPFNLAASPINASNLAGWQLFMFGGSNTNASFLVGTGSSTGNGVYSLGASASLERAMGSLASSTGISTIGLILSNQTSGILNSFTVSFTAEQWRKGGSGNKNTWTCRYKTGIITHIDQTNLLDEPNLNFSSVITTSSATSLNGNLPINQQTVSYTVSGINWKPGEQLLIRWDDIDETGSDDVVGIDNFSFSATLTSGLPLLSNSTVTNITANSAQLNATANDNYATTSLLFEFDTLNTFSTASLIRPAPDTLLAGTGNTNVSAIISGLQPGTTYYFRSLLNNTNGTVTGLTQNFTTGINLPTITTLVASAVTTSTALLGGNITAAGGAAVSEKGIVWSSVNNNPTLANNKIIMGNGMGSFAQTISGFPEGTIIYVRAYAINTGGIAYGDSIRFATQTMITTLQTSSAGTTNAITASFSFKTVQEIAGLTAVNFSIVSNGITGAFITAIAGSANTFTITVNTGNGNGTLGVCFINDTGLSIPVNNKPFFSTNHYTIDKTAPQVIALSIPDRSMKVGDTIPVLVRVKPDPDVYQMTAGNINGFNLSGFTKTNDSTYQCAFVIVNGGIDVPASAGIPLQIFLSDQAKNSSLFQSAIHQIADPIDANKPFILSIQNPINGIYKAGDTLHFICRFTENIFITGGTPSISVTIGTSIKTAVYIRGTGSDSLLFRYIISNGSFDNDGIKTAGTITFNNATIKDSAGNTATVSFNNTLATKDIFVDAVIPVISSVTVPVNSIYKTGNILDFTVAYSKKVFVANNPKLPFISINIGDKSKKTVFVNGAGSSTLVFRYIIEQDDIDGDGIQTATVLSDSSFSITDSVGNRASQLLNNMGAVSGILINPPSIHLDKMMVPENGIYKIGDTLAFFILYNEPVFITGTTGTPSLKITVGSSSKQATYIHGTGTPALLFEYIIKPGDEDLDGIKISPLLSLNNSNVKDAYGNNAPLILPNTADSTRILIDGVQPAINSIQVPVNKTYKTGDTLFFIINYSKPVMVHANNEPPSIKMTIGSIEKLISYYNGSGTTNLQFNYIIQQGDLDKNGISMGTEILVNNAIIRDTIGNTALLTFKNNTSLSNVKIDAVPPSIISIGLPAPGIYTTGNKIDISVTYSKQVFVFPGSDTPFLSVTIGGKIKTMAYSQGAGSNSLRFSYTIQSGDMDLDGIQLISPLNDLHLLIRDSVGNSASATFNSNMNDIQINPPVVFVDRITIPTNGIYKTGDSLRFSVTYNDPVVVTTTNGIPSVKITIGSATKQAVYITTAEKNTLIFQYIVQPGDEDTDGLKINSAITLNNSSIKTSYGNNALLALPAENTNEIKIDGVAPLISTIQLPINRVFTHGDTLSFVLHFSEPVTLQNTTDTPVIKITIGSTEKLISYYKGSGTNKLLFVYTVQQGDLDKNGISIGSSVLVNNNLLTDSAGNAALLNFKPATSLSNIKIDAVSPAFTTARTDTIYICANNTGTSLSSFLAVTDEENSEPLTWKVKTNTKHGALSAVSYSMNSNGKNITPSGILYTPYKDQYGTDTITVEITDGINTSQKTIMLNIQPPITNNTIGSAQNICIDQPASVLSGTNPVGGSGLYTYAWESSIATDSTHFNTANGSNNQSDYFPPILNSHTWYRRKITSGPCSNVSGSIKITVVKNGIWKGSYNNDWHNSRNWCSNTLPNNTTDVLIYPNTLYTPFITDTARCNQLTITGNTYLSITGILELNGNINGADYSIQSESGTIVCNGTSPQNIDGKLFTNSTLQNMIINNPAGVLVKDDLMIKGNIILYNGSLQTNDHLILKSTAAVGASANGTFVKGKLRLEHFIKGGRRAFRLFGHPFTHSIGVNMLKDSMDITGENGSLNGFTTTATNQPSAFYHNPFTGNDSTGMDAGWLPFTQTNGIGENEWKKFSGIRLLVRGRPGQGLDGTPAGDGTNGTYLPKSLIVSLSGNINTGDQELTLTKGNYAGYHVIANPYTSNIDLSRISRGGNIGKYYWLWNPMQGKQGGYTSFVFRDKNILPKFGAFIAKTNDSTHNKLLFTENCKSTDASIDSTAPVKLDDIFYVELRLESDSIFWDRLLLLAMDSARTFYDRNDAEKFINSDVNFYSLSREQKMLSIDARPISNETTIPLGLQTNEPGSFRLRVASVNLPASNTLKLHDRYLNKWMSLEKDSSYSFAVNADTLSTGNSRFEISSVKSITDTMFIPEIVMKINPVPAKDKIIIQYKSPEKGNTSIRILNLSGTPLKTVQLGLQKEGQTTIQVADLLSGIYLVELRCGYYRGSQKMIKE